MWRTKEGQNEITVASIIIVLFTFLSLPVGKTKFLYAKTFFPIDEILLYDLVVCRVFKKDAPLLDDGFHPELNLFVTYSVLIGRSLNDFARYCEKTLLLRSRADFLALRALADTKLDRFV